ncbi:MAG: sulfotransferase family protein [Candidatus Binatia bacterium]
MVLGVIGAGFGRTGTFSLKRALERLGYGPCYHMAEVLANPAHIPVWSAAAEGSTIEWNTLFEGYRAAVDWPTSHFWYKLTNEYPEAKVLLTVRDSEKWYDSVYRTIYQSLIQPLPSDDPVTRDQRAMARKIVLEGTFEGRFADRTYAIAVYEQHNTEVRRIIEPSRLLVYEVTAGWEPLCEFLGCPTPNEPFPRLNTTAEFKRKR